MEVLIYVKSAFTKWRLDWRVQGPSCETRVRPAVRDERFCLNYRWKKQRQRSRWIREIFQDKTARLID